MSPENISENTADINTSFDEEWAAFDTAPDRFRFVRQFPGAKILPVPLGSKGAHVDFRSAKTLAEWGNAFPAHCNIGFVPASAGLIVVDLDQGHDVAWAEANLPATLTVKSPHGAHLYYRSDEQFGNGGLGKHLDIRSAHGYVCVPGSVVGGIPYIDKGGEPIALPEGVRGLLRAKREHDNRPPDPDVDGGDDNESNLAKARMTLNAIDPSEGGYDIACRLRRDIGLSKDAAVELFAEWSDTLDWPWDYDKIKSVCRNAGKFGNGAKGQFGGAGKDAYAPDAIAPAAADPSAPAGAGSASRPKVTFSKGEETVVEWLWDGWLPRGKMVLLAGRPDDGKSMITINLGATVTVGGKWPDGSSCGKPGDVLIWSGEDEWRDTILPRFLAAGGDRSRFHHIDKVGDRPFDPATDMGLLDDAIAQFPDTRMLIVDPVIVVAETRANETANTRRAMQPMLKLVERHNLVALGITHFTKGTQDMDLLERLIGSQAWGAAARVVLVTVSNERTNQRRLVRIKSNVGPKGDGFEYQTEAADTPSGIASRRIQWGAPVFGAPHKLYYEVAGTDVGGKIELARKFILGHVPQGGVPSAQLLEEAKEAGISAATFKRAKTELTTEKLIHAYPGANGKWATILTDAGKQAADELNVANIRSTSIAAYDPATAK